MNVSAQNSASSEDSISIVGLMDLIEKTTPYKIYTTISEPFMVKKPDGSITLRHLDEALKGTSWKTNVYGNRVFVMRNLDLQTALPKTWTDAENGILQEIKVTEVLTSENLVYELGDKFDGAGHRFQDQYSCCRCSCHSAFSLDCCENR